MSQTTVGLVQTQVQAQSMADIGATMSSVEQVGQTQLEPAATGMVGTNLKKTGTQVIELPTQILLPPSKRAKAAMRTNVIAMGLLLHNRERQATSPREEDAANQVAAKTPTPVVDTGLSEFQAFGEGDTEALPSSPPRPKGLTHQASGAWQEPWDDKNKDKNGKKRETERK